MDDLPPALLMLPGSLLLDESWLAARVDQTGRQYGCQDRRINATLWWYSASFVLLGPAVQALVRSDPPVDLSASSLRLTVRPNGFLERVIWTPPDPGPDPVGPDPVGPDPVGPDPVGPDPVGPVRVDPDPAGALGRHLEEVLTPIIEPLARTGRASERSLWAIAADSLGTRLLAETAVTTAGTDRAPQLATAVAGATARFRPVPRYQDVAGASASGPHRYVRRGSCCLLLLVSADRCLSCPRQTPADRLERLQRHARTLS